MSAMSNLEPNTRCWIPNDQLGWLAVTVSKITKEKDKYRIELFNDETIDEKFVIETDNLNEDNLSLPAPRNFDDALDDLTTLSHLNEASVLNAIKLRYQLKKIYTYSGIVLVAMNPFERMEHLYTRQVIEKYESGSKKKQPPHLFAIAEEAYKCMIKNNENQSIVVSGESGAGKTVSAKYIMRFFASVNSNSLKPHSMSKIERQILATNPIMEAFGNAKTTRNDNSSRFGKYLEISFDRDINICGANIRVYLLERSRLVFQAKSERNYHIFYQMIEGLDEKTKKLYNLTSAGDFNYLNQGNFPKIDGVDDSEEFKMTSDALCLVGIDESKQLEIFKILSALLHIGNIEVKKSGTDASLSLDDPHLIKACELLGIDSTAFARWIIKKQIVTRSEKIISNLKYHEAIVARDSVAKYIYTTMFDWLVDHINSNLCSSDFDEKAETFIGVLDIYGFEHFEKNSFEQFCINYSNEKLQQEFTQHVFKIQQNEYIKEGIEWSFIEFSDNQPCIDVIETRGGILSLLDEQCRLPSGSEVSWADKMFQSLTKPPHNKVFKKTRFGSDKFIVSHYALDVTYDIEGFLEKNRDSVSDIQNEMLKATSNAFFLEILQSIDNLQEREITTSSSSNSRTNSQTSRSTKNIDSGKLLPSFKIPSSNGGRLKKPTLGSIFRFSLIELMNIINSTNVHYIRCIKPNQSKKSWEFDSMMVLGQLRACGVLETIKMSCVGFPSKATFFEFLERFLFLLSYEDEVRFARGQVTSQKELKKMSCWILNKYINDNKSYQVGTTKIFFKSGVLGTLETAKNNKIRDAVVVIQKNLRSHQGRKQYFEARLSLINLQSSIKGFLVRDRITRNNISCIKIQSLVRGYLVRRTLGEAIKIIVELQSYVRGQKSRKILEKLKQDLKIEEGLRIELGNIRKKQEKDAEKKKLLELETKEKEIKSRTKEKWGKEREYTEREQQNGRSTLHDGGTTRPATFSKLEIELLDQGAKSNSMENSTEAMMSSKPERYLSQAIRNLNLRIQRVSINMANYTTENAQEVTFTVSLKLQNEFNEDINKAKRALKKIKSDVPFEDYSQQWRQSMNSVFVPPSLRSQDSIETRLSKAPTRADLENNFFSAKTDLKSYIINSDAVSTTIANLLLNGMEPPPEESDEIMAKSEVLFYGRLVSKVLKDMWKLGMNKESVSFLHEILAIFKKRLEKVTDPEEIISFGAFLLNNMNEIRKFITETRRIAMSDFDGKGFALADERKEYLKILLIMKRYFDASFNVSYNIWMKAIIHLLDRKSIDAIVLDETLYLARKSTDVYFRKLFHEGPKYKMFDVLATFNLVYLAMTSNLVEKKILYLVMHEMLIFVDIVCFNNVIQRSRFLSVEKGMRLKYNISLLIDWCQKHCIPDSPGNLMHLLQLCQILQLHKQGLDNIEVISLACDSLTKLQIDKILLESKYTHATKNSANSKSTEKDRDSLDLCINIEKDSFANAFFDTL